MNEWSCHPQFITLHTDVERGESRCHPGAESCQQECGINYAQVKRHRVGGLGWEIAMFTNIVSGYIPWFEMNRSVH
ncbi:hypothetical protein CEXT_29641 [Caerostris extrusa]|uniref:Uncharacterized protein n=1 Tax=Caerostris extrusa TaxID=172846 RepID=A0AAV4U5S5_CAEEX|nr:hypothetical protein CEXT_29641 [Caerostris extrusa]